MAKRDLIRHTLQESGTAMWAYLTKPDVYEGKKKYKMDVHFPKPTRYLQRLVEQINEMAKEELAKNKAVAKTQAAANKIKLSEDRPFGKVLDDGGKPTGAVYFRFVQNAEYQDKKTSEMIPLRPPALFDAKGNPITDPDFVVGNGSTVKVCWEFNPYCVKAAGVSLRMVAVQVIKHVPYGGGLSFEKTGFAVEEDGDDLSDGGGADPFGGPAEELDDDESFGDIESAEEETAEEAGDESLEDLFGVDEEETPAPAPAAKKSTGKGKGKGRGKAAAAKTELADDDF